MSRFSIFYLHFPTFSSKICDILLFELLSLVIRISKIDFYSLLFYDIDKIEVFTRKTLNKSYYWKYKN